MNSLFQRIILRYGVFLLLTLMSVGLLYFVCNFELRVKAPIHLFFDHHDRSWQGYMTDQRIVPFHPRDTLLVVQTTMGDVPFIVESIAPESGLIKMKLIPVGNSSFPNTYSDGFVFVGKEKLKDKVWRKNLP